MFNYYTGNENLIPQGDLDSKLIETSRRAMKSNNTQTRLIGMLSAQSIDQNRRKDENGYTSG